MRGNGRYSVGTFDGSRFKAETEQRDSDVGPNFYATQTWNDTEGADGRRIQIAMYHGKLMARTIPAKRSQRRGACSVARGSLLSQRNSSSGGMTWIC